MTKTETRIFSVLRRLYKAGGEPIGARIIAERIGVYESTVRKCFVKYVDKVVVTKSVSFEGKAINQYTPISIDN